MPENSESEAAPPKTSKGRKLVMIGVVAALMLVEGVAVYTAVKFLGGRPAPSSAAEGAEGAESTEGGHGQPAAEAGGNAGSRAEVALCELDAVNKREGRLLMFHIQVTAVVKKANEAVLQKCVQERQNTINDRVTTIIRSADPKFMNEPGLETIRRQIKFELDKITGDENVVEELLIPKLLQSQGNL